MTVQTTPGVMTLELDKIHPGENVRDLDEAQGGPGRGGRAEEAARGARRDRDRCPAGRGGGRMRRKDGKIEPGFIVFCVVVVWLLMAILAKQGDARPVSWNTSTASVYDGVALGGVTGCLGDKSPKWWQRNPTVAHKTLPCGTKIRLLYRGRKVTARVWDRGPYVGGREFDIDARVQRRLGFPWGVDAVRWRVLR